MSTYGRRGSWSTFGFIRIGIATPGRGDVLAICLVYERWAVPPRPRALVGDRFLPPNPVKPKSGIGTLTVVWADSSTTLASYSFKARDSKAYSLTGKVTGGTSSRFATGTAIDGLVGLPPNPVEPGETSSAVAQAADG